MKTTTVVGDAEFRSRLSQVLERFGSVAELARVVGITDNAIYKWLAGRGEPNAVSRVLMWQDQRGRDPC